MPQNSKVARRDKQRIAMMVIMICGSARNG
jgi:hypothetical protein